MPITYIHSTKSNSLLSKCIGGLYVWFLDSGSMLLILNGNNEMKISRVIETGERTEKYKSELSLIRVYY